MNKPYVFILDAQSLTGLTTARAIAERYYPVAVYTRGCESNISLQSNVWKCKVPVEGLFLSAIDALVNQIKSMELGEIKPILLTATDDGVVFLSQHRAILGNYFLIPLPRQNIVELLMNKSAFYKWSDESGFPLIKTVLCESSFELKEALANFPLPFILKPKVREATWNSRFPVDKVIFVEDEARRRALVENSESFFGDLSGVIIQKYIPGGDDQIYFVLFAYGLDGQLLVEFAGQKLAQWPPRGGSTLACVPYESNELIELTRSIFSKIEMFGLGSMEFKKCSETGRYYIIEPTVGRCDHQSLLAENSGCNLVIRFLDSLVKTSAPLAIKPTHFSCWVDEAAFLRLLKLNPLSALKLLQVVGFTRLYQIRPLLFRIFDLKPWFVSMRLLVRPRRG